MDNFKISIIIPVYNKEDYIAKCLTSIINQKYRNLEIIIVNDGSTDHTSQICEVYADQDHRIRLIHQCNKGGAEARN